MKLLTHLIVAAFCTPVLANTNANVTTSEEANEIVELNASVQIFKNVTQEIQVASRTERIDDYNHYTFSGVQCGEHTSMNLKTYEVRALFPCFANGRIYKTESGCEKWCK